MGNGSVEIAELDDEEGKVYAFGIDEELLGGEDDLKPTADEAYDIISNVFTHATVLVFENPVSGDLVLGEISDEDIDRLIEQHDD